MMFKVTNTKIIKMKGLTSHTRAEREKIRRETGRQRVTCWQSSFWYLSPCYGELNLKPPFLSFLSLFFVPVLLLYISCIHKIYASNHKFDNDKKENIVHKTKFCKHVFLPYKVTPFAIGSKSRIPHAKVLNQLTAKITIFQSGAELLIEIVENSQKLVANVWILTPSNKTKKLHTVL